MVTKFILSIAAALALTCFASNSQAQGPFDYQFGYTLGYQNSFRNRLPTPPYFAIYPPVYYGKRYERPYGDSPYASFPQLRSAPDYYPVPKETPLRSSTVMNPHVPHSVGANSAPVAVVPPRVGRTVEIINPYATEQEQVAIQVR
jgi:hypothetical protein